jgi:hypothetical protein
MAEIRNEHKGLLDNSERKNHLGDLEVDGGNIKTELK